MKRTSQRSPINVFPINLAMSTSAMSSSPPSTVIDCRGMQCPAPIITTAKAAKELAPSGGVLQVIADDEAFPLDIRSWCRSTKATLLQFDQRADGYYATIKVSARAGAAVAAMPAVKVIDCVGQLCPQPIVTIAKAAKQLAPDSEIEVVADDLAFPLDLRSWCRSSGSTLLSFDDSRVPYRARLRVAGTPAKSTSAPAAAAAPQRAMVAPPNSAKASNSINTGTSIRVDLSWFAPQERHLELVRALRDAPNADDVTVVMPDTSFNATLLQWCANESHALRSLNGTGPVIAELTLNRAALGTSVAMEPVAPSAAMTLTRGDNRCSLMVLHNDHEALLAALLVATGAASAGMDTSIFFTFWGLNLLRGDKPNEAAPGKKIGWMQHMFKFLMPKGVKRQKLGQMHFGGAGRGMLDSIMRSQNIMMLPELVATADEQGVRFVACTMSMSVMGIAERDLHPYTNLELGGVAAFVELARGASINMVF